MKCSLGISNFLEEISSLSHSVVFLYFFAFIAEEGFLISSCYSLELCIHETVGWRHRLSEHEFEQTLGDDEGQGNLACCSPWGHRVRRDLVTEQYNK